MDTFLQYLKLAAEEFPGKGTILEYAVEEVMSSEKVNLEYDEPNQATLLVVGNSSVGKTSLINKFNGITDCVEPTFMLEYYPPLRSNAKQSNEIGLQCHIWELGDGTLYEQALIYLTNSPNLTVVLCMDLSKPQLLYYTQEEFLNIILNFIKSRSDFEEVHKARVAQMPSEHADAGYLKPFPFPLVIIGCMYDIFCKFEPEKKRIITQFMRYLAHLYGAYLFYWTDKNTETTKDAKDILRHFAYGSEMPSSKKTDYSKAVIVPPYSDSFEDIDPGVADHEHNLERVRLLLEAHFPQEKISKSVSEENPADDPKYADPIIDTIRKQQLQKEALNKIWEENPEEEEEEEINNYKMVNPFADIEPVPFRNSTSDDKDED